jgi:phosphoenolpyruvate carboxylase
MNREADRQQLPALMRRDVRLLGDLLGEVIREAGGQGLAAEVAQEMASSAARCWWSSQHG